MRGSEDLRGFDEAIAWRGEREAVVVKPAGVSSEGAPDAALERLRRSLRWPEARLPHRLDRLTRGFLLVARDAASAAFHSAAVRERRWVKAYLARLVARDADVLAEALVGAHKAYLKRDGARSRVVRSGGDPSFLDILAIAPAPVAAPHAAPPAPMEWHAAIRLRTGRFHQIRAMCAELGHPLAGDLLYGAPATSREPTLEHALFSFPAFSEEGEERERITLWRRQDPAREPVAQSVLDALDAEATSARAMT